MNFGKYTVDLGAPTLQSGTSFAAPVVSGALALLLSEQKDQQELRPGYRDLTVGEIRYLLLSSTDRIAALEGITVSGGRLNIDRLLQVYTDDADGDGYAAQVERLFGTDPDNAADAPDLLNGDGDGDGVVNHRELAYGTVPIPFLAGTGYTDVLYLI